MNIEEPPSRLCQNQSGEHPRGGSGTGVRGHFLPSQWVREGSVPRPSAGQLVAGICFVRVRNRLEVICVGLKPIGTLHTRFLGLGGFTRKPCFHYEMSWCPLVASVLVLAPHCRRPCECPQQALPHRCRPHVTVVGNRPRRLATYLGGRNLGNSELQFVQAAVRAAPDGRHQVVRHFLSQRHPALRFKDAWCAVF